MYNSLGGTPFVCLTDGLWLLLVFVLLPKRWRSWWLVVLGLYTISLVANSCFCRVMQDFIPLQLFFVSSSYEGEVLESGVSLLQAIDLLYPIGFLTISILWLFVFKKKTPSYNIRAKVWYFIVCVVFSFGAYCFQIYRHILHNGGTYSHCFIRHFKPGFVFTDDMAHHGYLLTYGFYFIYNSLPEADLTDQEIDAYKSIRSEGELPLELKSIFEHNRDKHLILVVVESLTSQSLNKVVNGVEITPTLDSLLSDSTVISFSRVKSNAMMGNSSDGHLMYLTGLVPSNRCAITTTPKYTKLPSFCYILNNHTSKVFTGDSRFIWQANRYFSAAGVSQIHDLLFRMHHNSGDKCIFDAAFEDLKNATNPAIEIIITCTMHSPYNIDKVPPTAINDADEPDDIKAFDALTHYTDSCISQFIKQLKAEGLYDNSVIVIASDHRCRLFDDTDIPVFILNSGIKEKFTSDRDLIQLDVYPTILDVMGMSDCDVWYGMGNSALRPGIEPMTDEEFERRSQLSERLIRTNYFWQHDN